MSWHDSFLTLNRCRLQKYCVSWTYCPYCPVACIASDAAGTSAGQPSEGVESPGTADDAASTERPKARTVQQEAALAEGGRLLANSVMCSHQFKLFYDDFRSRQEGVSCGVVYNFACSCLAHGPWGYRVLLKVLRKYFVMVKSLHWQGHQIQHYSRKNQKPSITTTAFQCTQRRTTPVINRRHLTKGGLSVYCARATSNCQSEEKLP